MIIKAIHGKIRDIHCLHELIVLLLIPKKVGHGKRSYVAREIYTKIEALVGTSSTIRSNFTK